MDEDRYTRITLRLPKDLHGQLDAAADATSKSLNAEIVGRLETSFLQAGDLTVLRDKLAAAENEARQHELRGIRERLKSQQFLVALTSITERIPQHLIELDSELASLVHELRGKQMEMIHQGIVNMIADMNRVDSVLKDGVASGRIQVVPQDQVEVIKAKRRKKS